MQYRAIHANFFRKKKKIVILFKKAKNISRIINKNPSKTGKNLLLPSLLMPKAFSKCFAAGSLLQSSSV